MFITIAVSGYGSSFVFRPMYLLTLVRRQVMYMQILFCLQMTSSSGDDDWKTIFKTAILTMCKNGLYYHEQISVEGVLAVTLDKSRVVVISINELCIGKNDVASMPIANTNERSTAVLSKIFHQNDSHGPGKLLVSG